MYYVYDLHTENFTPPPKIDRNYEALKREIEALKVKAETPPQNSNTPPDYADIIERVMPAIVFVETNKGTGSGFFVTQDGDILTNYHVVENAEFVKIFLQDGSEFNAQIKDYDDIRDMALLKINLPYRVKFLRMSGKYPRQGEAVIAIGNPRGLSGSVSNGIVSAIRETKNNVFVQFTAPVSPGSSFDKFARRSRRNAYNGFY